MGRVFHRVARAGRGCQGQEARDRQQLGQPPAEGELLQLLLERRTLGVMSCAHQERGRHCTPGNHAQGLEPGLGRHNDRDLNSGSAE